MAEISACGKVRHASKAAAKKASKAVKANGAKGKTTQYKCDKCNGWHLTSMVGKELTLKRNNTHLASQFKIGQVWSDKAGSFEVVSLPINAKGLAHILSSMTINN